MSNNTSCGSCGSGGSMPKGCKSNGHCASGGCDKLDSFDWLANTQETNAVEYPYVEIRFKNDRKQFFINSDKLDLQVGSIVCVESSPGHDVGIVSLKGALADIQMNGKRVKKDEEIKKIYRIASQKDIDKWQEVREEEYKTMVKTREIVKHLRLDMKICDVEYQGDGSKATFYYTADGRVDFRELIKELASNFKVRIEMRQIGYRQGAAKVGGIGSCGRELCCSTWLTDFRSVNTIAARYQQLSINPQKLAGQCGKLKCCLNYELDSYLEAFKKFPELSVKINTEKGYAQCMKMDIFKEEVWYAYSKSTIEWFKLSVEVANKLIAKNKKGEKVSSLEDYVAKEENAIAEVVFKSSLNDDNINRFKEDKKTTNNRRRPQAKKNKEIATNNKATNEKTGATPKQPRQHNKPKADQLKPIQNKQSNNKNRGKFRNNKNDNNKPTN